MSFGDEIFRALTGRQHEPTSFNEILNDVGQFRAEIGMSRRAFARQTGIPESTLRRWEKDGITSKAQEARLPQLNRAYRQLISSPAAIERWRNNGMVIHVRDVPASRGRTQDLDLTANRLKLAPGTGNTVVNAFLAGDDAGAAKAFVRGIRDPWYRSVLFGGWMSHDEDLSDLAYEGDYDGADDYEVAASAS